MQKNGHRRAVFSGRAALIDTDGVVPELDVDAAESAGVLQGFHCAVGVREDFPRSTPNGALEANLCTVQIDLRARALPREALE